MGRKAESAARSDGTGGAPIASLGRRGSPLPSAPQAGSQEAGEVVRTVYDGQVQLGAVIGMGTEFQAILASGRTLGMFPTALAAARAISGRRRDEAVESDGRGA